MAQCALYMHVWGKRITQGSSPSYCVDHTPSFFPPRLVGGLASEKVRWADSVQKFQQDEKTLAGDVLLTSSYLSYVGCFGRSYRIDLLENKWMPFLTALNVSPTCL